jgi:hypothetical protein
MESATDGVDGQRLSEERGLKPLAKARAYRGTRVPRTTAQFTKPPNQKPSQFLNIYSSIITYLIKTILGLFDSA